MGHVFEPVAQAKTIRRRNDDLGGRPGQPGRRCRRERGQFLARSPTPPADDEVDLRAPGPYRAERGVL
jgi:hypothetical protein